MVDEIKDIDFLNGEQQGVELLPDFLQRGENIKTLVNAFQAEIQELYNATQEISVKSMLSVAIGNILDRYGERVDLERTPGQSDDSYRVAIQAQIKSTAAHGSIQQLIELLNTLIGSDNAILTELFPAAVLLLAVVDPLDFDMFDEVSIYNQMQKARAAGVRLDVGVQSSETPFTFTSLSDPVLPNQGFSSVAAPSVGGKFAKLFNPPPSGVVPLTLVTESGLVIQTESGLTLIAAI